MTTNQRILLAAAKDVLAWLDRRHAPDYLPKGQYEDLALARMLHVGIQAVEAEERERTEAPEECEARR